MCGTVDFAINLTVMTRQESATVSKSVTFHGKWIGPSIRKKLLCDSPTIQNIFLPLQYTFSPTHQKSITHLFVYLLQGNIHLLLVCCVVGIYKEREFYSQIVR